MAVIKLPEDKTEDSDVWSEDESSDSSSSSSDTSLDLPLVPSQEESNVPKKPAQHTVKTKGELGIDDLPPIENLVISLDENEVKEIGIVYAIIEKLVVVRSYKDERPLDIDSVLFLSPEKPLGKVFDVFGPIAEPFYSVRFNQPEDIAEKGVAVDAPVFFAPSLPEPITRYVFLEQLQSQKGSDASWKDNNEPPDEHLDFSDDEQERLARKKRNPRNRTPLENSEHAPAETPVPPPSQPPPAPAPTWDLRAGANRAEQPQQQRRGGPPHPAYVLGPPVRSRYPDPPQNPGGRRLPLPAPSARHHVVPVMSRPPPAFEPAPCMRPYPVNPSLRPPPSMGVVRPAMPYVMPHHHQQQQRPANILMPHHVPMGGGQPGFVGQANRPCRPPMQPAVLPPQQQPRGLLSTWPPQVGAAAANWFAAAAPPSPALPPSSPLSVQIPGSGGGPPALGPFSFQLLPRPSPGPFYPQAPSFYRN